MMIEKSAAILYTEEHPFSSYENNIDTAITEIYRGNPGTALYLFQKELETSPDNIYILKWTGIAFEQLKDRVLAAKYYLKAIHITEENDLYASFTKEIQQRLRNIGF